MADKLMQARLLALRKQREQLAQEEAQLIEDIARVQRAESYAFKDKLLSWIHYIQAQDPIAGSTLLAYYNEGRLHAESMHTAERCSNIREAYYSNINTGQRDNLVVLEIRPALVGGVPFDNGVYEWIVLRVADKGTYPAPASSTSASSSSVSSPTHRVPMSMEMQLIRANKPRYEGVHPSNNFPLDGTFSPCIQIDLSTEASIKTTLHAWDVLVNTWCRAYDGSVLPDMGDVTESLRRLLMLAVCGPSLYARTCLPMELLYTESVEEFEALTEYIVTNPCLCMKCWTLINRSFSGVRQFCFQGMSAQQIFTSQLVYRACTSLDDFSALRKTPSLQEKQSNGSHGVDEEPAHRGEFEAKFFGKTTPLTMAAMHALDEAVGKALEQQADSILQRLYGDAWGIARGEKRAPKPSARKRAADEATVPRPSKKQKISE